MVANVTLVTVVMVKRRILSSSPSRVSSKFNHTIKSMVSMIIIDQELIYVKVYIEEKYSI